MLTVLIPAAVVIVAFRFRKKKPKDYGVMTAERKGVYNAILSGSLKDPDKIDEMAAQFHSQGLKAEAKLLRQRAALRRLPDETKKARKEAFRQALESKDKVGILNMAIAYDNEGCTGAAAKLREVASGLPDNIEDMQT